MPDLTMPTVADSSMLSGHTMLLASFMGLLAVVGWRVGVRRQAFVLFASAACAWLVATLWPGVLTSLQEAFPILGGLHEPVVFLAGVSTAYLSSRLVRAPVDGGMAAVQRLPGLLDKSMGAALGAATGFLAGQFVLPRLLAPANGALEATADLRTDLSGLFIWLVIAVFILFGVASLSGSKGVAE
jgi:hypothetical protein